MSLIHDEENARVHEDGLLWDAIDKERADRADADAQLQANIDAEAGAREETDSALDERVTALENQTTKENIESFISRKLSNYYLTETSCIIENNSITLTLPQVSINLESDFEEAELRGLVEKYQCNYTILINQFTVNNSNSQPQSLIGTSNATIPPIYYGVPQLIQNQTTSSFVIDHSLNPNFVLSVENKIVTIPSVTITYRGFLTLSGTPKAKVTLNFFERK